MLAATQTNHSVPLLVAIVNYRTADLTIQCLRSLVHEVATLPGMQVVVVDNASGDGSADKIAAAIATAGWDWATLLPSEINGGFAYGNNAAIRPALESPNPPPYFMLLNPDTEVRPQALKTMIDFLDTHPDVGIVGSGIETVDGSLWPVTFRFPSIFSELDGGLRIGFVSRLLSPWVIAQEMTDAAQPVDWLPGAGMMIRRQVFEQAGLMDEGYFLYYEETDFCLQAKRAGWTCWYLPQSRIMHISGQSTGVTGNHGAPKRQPKYLFDSRRHYFVKNHGWLYAVLCDIVWVIGFMVWRCRRMIQRKPDLDPPYMLWDFCQNSILLSPVMKFMPVWSD
ncbi:glycosyltransferase family 2 protein [Pantanalinema rosaneae CENA516]|uniref:glycosyltransferase family 2 protein n=1 Tax=Pantanalinema rosaneae TaxID=1620701 RepID=UPI003D6FD8A3